MSTEVSSGRALWVHAPRLVFGFVLAALVIALSAAAGGRGGGRHAAAGQSSGLSVSFGPEQVWLPPPPAVGALQQCIRQNITCVQAAMEQHGAPAGAIAFYRLTAWLLTDLQDTGVVKLGTVLSVWRANENTQPVLLGGVPAVIFPEEQGWQLGSINAVEFDPAFKALKEEHPDAMFWAPGPRLHGIETSPQGGQRFVFDYRVLDGCHACSTLALARFGFDFLPDGTFAGAPLLEIVPQ